MKISINQLLLYSLHSADTLACQYGYITDGITIVEEIDNFSVLHPVLK